MEYKSDFEYFQEKRNKEIIHLDFMKNKLIIVNIILFISIVLSIIALIYYKQDMETISRFSLGLAGLLFVNYIFLTIKDNRYSYLSLSMYISFFGIFTLILNLLLVFKLPSLFTLILIGVSFAMLLMNKNITISSFVMLIFIFIVIAVNNPEYFVTLGNNKGIEQLALEVVIFSVAFMLICVLQSYFLITKRSKQIDHLTHIYESEYKNQDIIIDLSNEDKLFSLDGYKEYYDLAEKLLKKLSKENNIEDPSDLLKDIFESIQYKDAGTEPYIGEPDDIDIKKHFYQLSLDKNSKLRRVAIRGAFSKDIIQIKKNYDISEFINSINNKKDSLEVKILLFSLFYSVLRYKEPFMAEMSDKEVYSIIIDSNYSANISSDILRVYRENNDVINDIFLRNKKGGNLK